MTDFMTPAIRLTEPTIGGDESPLWPTILNNDLAYIDQATNQIVTIPVADVNYTLTADGTSSDQARYAGYNITGAWTVDRTISLPHNVKIGFVINSTTGGHNVILSAGATTLTVPPGSARVRFEVDGSNNVTSPFLSSGLHNASLNGYTPLGGGLFLQWGFASTSGSGFATVTFPIAFASQCFSMTVTPNTPNDLSAVVVTLTRTNAGITIFSGPGVGASSFFFWMAVGL